jgi:prepilin-type N-terminal cleavage/methylation domain-containing protein
MRTTTHLLAGPLLRSTGGQRGFTLAEMVVAMAVSSAVVAAVIVSYVGTLRSWEGTTRLANLQRDGSFCMEVMSRHIRAGSEVDIAAAGDSLDITFWTGSADSLIGRFYDDGNGNLVDMNGYVLTQYLSDLNFSTDDDRVVNVDLLLEDNMGTPERTSDDQQVFISSTATCRN